MPHVSLRFARASLSLAASGHSILSVSSVSLFAAKHFTRMATMTGPSRFTLPVLAGGGTQLVTVLVSFPESQFIHLAMPDCISLSRGDWRARQDAPMCAVCLQATQKAVSFIRACATLNRVNSVAALCLQCDTLQGLLYGQVSIESKGEYGSRKVAFIGNQRQ